MGLTPSRKSRQKLKDFVSWFEIPVYDIHRAADFYNAIYHMDMQVTVNGEFAMAFFPADSGIGGALVAGPGCTPNALGVLIYLNAGNDLDSVLGRIEPAGGRVIMPRTLIDDSAGAFALFIDSEGNRLALHEGPAPMGAEMPASAVPEPRPAAGAVASRQAKTRPAKRVATPGARKVASASAAKAVKKGVKKAVKKAASTGAVKNQKGASRKR